MNALRKRQDKHLSLDTGSLELLESDWQEEDARRGEERAAALNHCLEQLPAKSRELIRKRYFQEVDYPKLAEELKRTVNSLYVTFSRIHAALAQITARLIAEEEHG